MFIYFHIYGYYLFICFHSLARSISISRFPKYSHYPPRGIPCSGHIDFKFHSPVGRHHGAFHSQFIRNYFSLSLTILTSSSPSPSPFMCMNLDLIRIATGWILCKMKYGLNIYIALLTNKNRDTKIESEKLFSLLYDFVLLLIRLLPRIRVLEF